MPALLALLLLVVQGPSAATFPDSEAGRRAAAFFEALDSGEAPLRAFFEANVSPGGLRRRSVADRLAVLRGFRAERGHIGIDAVHETPDGVSVEAHDEHGGKMTIDVLLEPEPPRLFAGLRVLDSGGSAGPPPAPAGPPMTAKEVVGALRERLASSSSGFSGAVLLAKGDEVLVREATGLASREEKRPNKQETRFNLGSINKAFTRLAIEQLAAAGKLSLDDTLDRWVPEYPVDKGRRITLRQLLEHGGGTGDFFGPRFEAADRSKLLALRDWLPLISDGPLRFEPGTRQEYSNAGYLLLGLAVEKASGVSYYDYVKEHVFVPAGMKDSGSFTLAEGGTTLATGYRREGDRLVPNRDTLPARGTSAGGGYSTVDDLFRFAKWTRRTQGPEQGLSIAGGAPGLNAALIMAGDWTAVVLANLDPPAAEDLAAQIHGWLRRAGAGGEGGERRVVHAGSRDDEHGRPRATHLPEAGVDVPMRRAGHMPVVEVMVEGKGPFLFAIDTGGAGTLRVNKGLVEKLSLPVVGEVHAGDPSGRNPRVMPLVEVKEIAIGAARFEGLVGASRDYDETGGRSEPIDGILGFGLFAETLLTLDYPGNRVRIARGELPTVDGKTIIPFTAQDGIPSIEITVAGKRMSAHVDAGSMGGLILPKSEAASLPLAEPLKVVGHARTVSNSFDIEAAPLRGDVAIGGLTLANPMLEFQPVMPFANVGSRVLRDLVVTFDQKNGRMRLVKP